MALPPREGLPFRRSSLRENRRRAGFGRWLCLASTFGVWLAGAASARGAGNEAHPWREVCWLPGEDVSFAGIQVEGQGGAAAAHAARAQKARIGLEVNGLRGRLRVQMIAPFELTFTTENFALGSLSLRPAGLAAGILQILQPGVVRLAGISGDGRTIDVAAGALMVRGLPLACEELVAVQGPAAWLVNAGTHRASDVPRLFVAAAPTAASVAVGPVSELPVTVQGKPRGEWARLTYAGSADGKPAFTVSGWARKPRLRPSGVAALAGGTIPSEGLRACAPTSPLAPRELTTVDLPAGTVLYESAQGDKVWARLTSPVRAIVARYPSGRAALAGLPGWTWPSWKCETAWLEEEQGARRETPARAPDAGAVSPLPAAATPTPPLPPNALPASPARPSSPSAGGPSPLPLPSPSSLPAPPASTSRRGLSR